MQKNIETPSGITVQVETQDLGDLGRLDFLVGRLDRERGCYLSSGVEYPDRYSRWDIGFVSPPIEFVGRERTLNVNALNERGEQILRLLAPILKDGEEITEVEEGVRTLALTIGETDEVFPEEQRSRQPSLFTPLRRLLNQLQSPDMPFLGLYGAFGYDLIFQFEPVHLEHDRSHSKTLHLFLPDCIYVVDRFKAVDRNKEQTTRYDYVFTKDDITSAGLSSIAFHQLTAPPIAPSGAPIHVTSDHTAEEYMDKVRAAKERIRVGDIFEVVLSRQFEASYDGPPSLIYREMQKINPSPYEFFMQFGDEQLVGASPEMFVNVQGDRVETCPISGTIRRGDNAMEDADRVKQLLNSAKDEVELTMCTDVDRNDKARICEPGSVKLLGRRLIERYAGLFHTVDHVEGKLRQGFDGMDAFFSHMWAVTLTGAPKPKAVSIIEKQEKSARDWYGGAIGALAFDGDVMTGITIRTVHLKQGKAIYRAGASLVWDSVPEEEELETKTKSTAFFRILERLNRRNNAGEVDPPKPQFDNVRIVMVDNEDSFVHTLADYLRQTGATVLTYRHNHAKAAILQEKPDLVVHSPGPGTPSEMGVPELVNIVTELGIPQFGVCLGLQGICEAFGGELGYLNHPRHGKTWALRHSSTGIYEGLEPDCTVGAYHSLHAKADKLPDCFEITGKNYNDGSIPPEQFEEVILSIQHKTLPIAAVQYHPESILSMGKDAGLRLIANVIRTLVKM